MPFFDTASGTYKTAHSEPIPLQVKQTTTITAMDAEGQNAAPVGKEIKTISQGIAHNYDDNGVLESLVSRAPMANKPLWWWLILLLPPGLFGLILLAGIVKNNILNDPAAQRRRQAQAVLKKNLTKINPAAPEALANLNRAMQEYLGAKLGVAPASLTFADVQDKLAECGVNAALTKELQDILTTCEAHAYAGGATGQDNINNLVSRAQDVGREIERCWR